jgi:hypothetical protein
MTSRGRRESEESGVRRESDSLDPCRLVRQVKDGLATELLHLPDKPAGVCACNCIESAR